MKRRCEAIRYKEANIPIAVVVTSTAKIYIRDIFDYVLCIRVRQTKDAL